MDGDTFLNPALLKNTIEALDSGRICAGGAVLKFDSQTIGFFASLMVNTWNPISAWLGLAAGSYLFCLRKAWVETGGFNEDYYAAEEIYFSKELKRWGAPQGLKFKVFTQTPIVTSARKIEWYGQFDLISKMLRMGPGSIRHRDKCDLWYTRPPEP